MGTDAAGTVERQKTSRRELIDPIISSHRGRLFKSTGDGFLVEFSSIVDAANCAVAIQRDIADKQNDAPAESRISYRIGIHSGEIIEDEGDIFGDGVNVAARIEVLAPPGGICVSDTVRENLRAQLDIAFEDIGRQALKNIDRKVQVWRWRGDAAPTAKGSAGDGVAQPGREQTTIAVLPFL